MTTQRVREKGKREIMAFLGVRPFHDLRRQVRSGVFGAALRGPYSTHERLSQILRRKSLPTSTNQPVHGR